MIPDRFGRRALLGGLAASAAAVVLGAACRSGDGDDPAGDGSPESPVTGSDEVGREVAYGEAELQRGALSLPDGAPGDGGRPVVVLVHGGFWRAGFERSLMDPLVASLLDAGWATWNLDHRGVGEGGGWPTTFTDVAAGVDHLAALADEEGLDLDRVAIVGHSAGGTLALWAAGRGGLPADAPGAAPGVAPVAAVSLAGVTSLVAASFEDLGRGAAEDLMGGPPDPEREEAYFLASPSDRLPLGVPQLLVHGAEDPLVPPVQSTAHAARAEEAGDEAEVRVVEGAGHFEVVDPASDAWAGVVDWLEERLA